MYTGTFAFVLPHLFTNLILYKTDLVPFSVSSNESPFSFKRCLLHCQTTPFAMETKIVELITAPRSCIALIIVWTFESICSPSRKGLPCFLRGSSATHKSSPILVAFRFLPNSLMYAFTQTLTIFSLSFFNGSSLLLK